MVKQLYYSEIHLKNIEVYLSKLYISKYSEVHGLLIVLMEDTLLIISRVQVFCDVIS